MEVEFQSKRAPRSKETGDELASANGDADAEEMRRQLTDKAIEDSAFRAKLVADPKGVIEEEFGIAVPDFLEIKVHESEPKVLHLSLPPSSDVELDEDQLEAIAAGLSCCL